jgi:hypothetical protein
MMLTYDAMKEAVRLLSELPGVTMARRLDRNPNSVWWTVTAEAFLPLAQWREGGRARWEDAVERVGQGWFTFGRDVSGKGLDGAVHVVFVCHGEPTAVEGSQA